MDADFDIELKTAIYAHVATTARMPRVGEMAATTGRDATAVRDGYRRLAARRVLVLEDDGETIRMAPPFSGVDTQHRVRVGGREYVANCAWDALGVVAALGGEGEVRSRCDHTLEPLRIRVDPAGPEPVPSVVHFAVPAARWWDDIVHT